MQPTQVIFFLILLIELSFANHIRQKRFYKHEDSGHNTIHRLPSDLIEDIPNAEEILNLQREILERIPPKYVSDFVNKICNSDAARNYLRPNDKLHKDLHFDLIHKSINISAPYYSYGKIIAQPEFNQNWNVTVFLTGWSSPTYGDVPTMANAYRCRGKHNFLLIDVGQYVNTVKEWYTLDTEAVGNLIGESLAEQDNLVPARRYHLIGHGVGAHVAGAAARRFKELTGSPIPRVTGLDPANRCGHPKAGLQSGDASFVDVIHSNNGIFGQSKAVGDVDFYPNGIVAIPPGCSDVMCAHYSAVNYYAETITPGMEDSYVAVQGTSLESVQNQDENTEKISMGYAVPVSARGTYVLETNAGAPYGKNVNYDNEIKCNL